MPNEVLEHLHRLALTAEKYEGILVNDTWQCINRSGNRWWHGMHNNGRPTYKKYSQYANYMSGDRSR